MYELIQVGKDSFFMDCPAKVGFYRTGEREAVLIDSGSDKDAAKKVKRILDGQGWKLRAIYNTHSHGDHTGGNKYLQNLTGCPIYAPGMDCSATVHPLWEPIMLYGGYPMKELRNKFLMAPESNAEPLLPETLPNGMELLPLPGHSYDMVGFRTADNVVYLADCLCSAETLDKYKIGFLYDVQGYLDTLEHVKKMEAACFVPAHAPHTEDIAPLAQLNIDCVLDVLDTLKRMLEEPKTFEALTAEVFRAYGLTMTLQQRMLVGSALKSYLAYLKDNGRVTFFFEDALMKWQTVR